VSTDPGARVRAVVDAGAWRELTRPSESGGQHNQGTKRGSFRHHTLQTNGQYRRPRWPTLCSNVGCPINELEPSWIPNSSGGAVSGGRGPYPLAAAHTLGYARSDVGEAER